ncbi:GD24963 [Drosophila simulans]|uniref:GD24963 n=1 Tax=Drosophila simulans TaxID=7240 RepID=B4QBX7_DROSI|nr:GD24963 [Drosophila simulans]
MLWHVANLLGVVVAGRVGMSRRCRISRETNACRRFEVQPVDATATKVVQLCQVVDKSPSPVAQLPQKRSPINGDDGGGGGGCGWSTAAGGDQESPVVQHMAAMTTHVNSFLKSLHNAGAAANAGNTRPEQ